MNFSQKWKGAVILISLALYSSSAFGLIDFNGNGLSDIWEKAHNNGNLFPATFDLQADPDGDGWTNAQEAIAGTDPFDATQPGGLLVPSITIIPATYYDPNEDGIPDILTPDTATVTWPTIPGKLYTLQCSPDLEQDTWVAASDPVIGDGSATGEAVQLTQADGSIPERLFWRVLVEDTDSDQDELTDAEEIVLGSNPFNMYSDSDFLSDTLEIFNYGTDPTLPDTNENGILDHDEPALLGSGGGNSCKYAPVFDWWGHTRSLTYDYANNTGSITTAAYWDDSLGGRSASPRRALEGLNEALNTAIPFPLDKSNGANYMYPISNYSRTAATYDYALIHHKQVRLFASSPPETTITKNLMVLRYVARGDVPPTSIESYPFSISATGIVSSPQFFGRDFVATNEAYQFLEFYTPQFQRAVDLGWDETGAETTTNVGMGEATEAILAVSLPPAANPLLEIAPSAASEEYITLSEHTLPLSTGSFKIHGVKVRPVGDNSADEVVLRLKANPSVVFAKIKVYVFNKREVPVSIFRIWDSRITATAFSAGISNAKVIAALNETYALQGNIHFTLASNSAAVDLKHDPNKWSWQDDEPQRFDSSGKFVYNGTNMYGVNDLVSRRNGQYSEDRLMILIPSDFDVADLLGFQLPETKTCFFKSSVDKLTCAHEVGHVVDLASKATGAENAHDLGSWPQEFRTGKKVGLMFDEHSDKMTEWLRQEDWVKTNQKAKELK